MATAADSTGVILHGAAVWDSIVPSVGPTGATRTRGGGDAARSPVSTRARAGTIAAQPLGGSICHARGGMRDSVGSVPPSGTSVGFLADTAGLPGAGVGLPLKQG